MSLWVKDKVIIEGKKPREKPFGLPYQSWIDKMKQSIKSKAIEKAKTNDKKHKPIKEIQSERKTIHWLDY